MWKDGIMANYFLFLDELKPNDKYKHFCLGGIFVEEVYYRKEICSYVNDFKYNIFKTHNIILHENEFKSYKGKYKALRDKNVNKTFFDGLHKLFREYEFKTLCVCVDYAEFKKNYPTKGSIANSEYYVALQIILENFVHFLNSVNSIGCVYIESRGLTADYDLQIQYELIKKQGTLFIPPDVFQKRLKAISFPLKIDNNIGLQIADLIPNSIARNLSNIEQKEFTLYDDIIKKSYDGNHNMHERFGIKKVL
jgi:hypothetical protein